MPVRPSILAFRPATVVARLDRGSQACPLSTRELLGPAVELGVILPVVRAPIAAVARGALVAAKEARSPLGLALPPGAPAAPWFAAVTRAADELAAGLPIFLSAQVALAGEGALQVEAATADAWRLLDAGITHLTLDVGAVSPGERGRVAADVAQAAAERGACVEVVVSLSEGPASASRAAVMLEALSARGAAADLASVACPAPADEGEARIQARALARLSRALGGVAMMRRGPVTPAVLAALRGAPSVVACDDGGAAAERALRLVAPAAPDAEDARGRESALERAASELSEDAANRLEARAYVDALDLVERLGARGSAPAVARVLERRLEARG